MNEDKDYSRQHEAILAEERATINKRKAKAEAYEENFKKFIEEAFKNPNTKKNVGKDAYNAGKASESGQGPRFDKYEHGFSGGVVEEEFTGFSEERPWERDLDEE